MKAGQRYTLVAQVRDSGARGFLDGEFLTEFADYTRLSPDPTFTLRDRRCVGFGTATSNVFHSVELREVTGKATLLRAPAVASTTAVPPPVPASISTPAASTARDLFNGRDAAGWTGPGGAPATISWRIGGGSVSSSQRTTLWSAESFGDFELELEWKAAPQGNGGVFYHVPGTSELEGPEMQLCDPANGGGSLSGGLYGIKSQSRDASKSLGQWNTAKLVVRGQPREHRFLSSIHPMPWNIPAVIPLPVDFIGFDPSSTMPQEGFNKLRASSASLARSGRLLLHHLPPARLDPRFSARGDETRSGAMGTPTR